MPFGPKLCGSAKVNVGRTDEKTLSRFRSAGGFCFPEDAQAVNKDTCSSRALTAEILFLALVDQR